jgi:tetratricopeptide (TPR) repeat protein
MVVRASHHARKAGQLQRSKRQEQALPHLRKTQSLWEALGIELEAAKYGRRIGVSLIQLGRHSEAAAALEAAHRVFTTHQDEYQVAACDQALGACLRELGRYDEAITYLETATRIFRARGDNDGLARCDVTLANLFSVVGRGSEAWHLYAEARNLFAEQGGDVGVATCDLDFANLLIKDWFTEVYGDLAESRYEIALQNLQSSREYFLANDLAQSAAMCNVAIGQVLIEIDHGEEGLELLEAARSYFSSHDLTLMQAACELAAGKSLIRMGLLAKAPDRLLAARNLFASLDLGCEVSYCNHNLAVAAHMLGDNQQAIVGALQALQTLEAARYALSRPEDRHGWLMQHIDSYGLALSAALESSQFSLVAELVESARVQGLPRRGDNQGGSGSATQDTQITSISSEGSCDGDESARSAAVVAAGLAPLGAAPQLVLFEDTESAWAAAVQAEPRRQDRSCLARAARAAAGEAWWWWGMWAVHDWLYWSAIGHAGSVEAGRIPLGQVLGLLDELETALPHTEPGETGLQRARRMANSPFASPAAEADFSLRLGLVLVPPPLRARLLEVDSGNPLSLIVAPAPILGHVAFSLLRLDEGSRTLRLAERAVLRLGVSVPLLEIVAERGKPPPLFPASIAVLDSGSDGNPADDNEGTRISAFLESGAQVSEILSRPAHIALLAAKSVPADVGTREAFGSRLRQRKPDVLIYVGHSIPARNDQPTATALPLWEDDPFSAADWLYGTERYPAPPRLALVACSSSGVRSTEWLGLAPAALWAGSSVVIGSSWDLPNVPSTWTLAADVTKILQDPGDPALGLRNLVLERLQAWQQGQIQSGPLAWGGLHVVGAS